MQFTALNFVIKVLSLYSGPKFDLFLFCQKILVLQIIHTNSTEHGMNLRLRIESSMKSVDWFNYTLQSYMEGSSAEIWCLEAPNVSQ